MKKYLIPVFTAILMLASCIVEPDIIFSEGNIPSFEISSNGANQSFAFTATQPWSASSSASWCAISPASGEAGDFRLSVKVEENTTPDPRQATITLQCGDVVRTVQVSQSQKDMMTLSKTSFEVAPEGGEITVSASCNVTVTAEVVKGTEWISGGGTKALQVKDFVFKIAENKGEDDRAGEIEFKNAEAGISAKVTVSQKAVEVFELSSDKADVEAVGGSFSVTVRSSLSYSVSSMPEWVKEVKGKAVSTKTHSFEVLENPDTEIRSGIIVFCNESGVCVPFTVTQAAAEPEPEPDAIDWSKSFVHKSLIMRFTATWCGYCPIMAETVALAQANRPGRYEVVNIHGGGSDLQFNECDPLIKQYKIRGFPTSVIDGRKTVNNYAPATAVKYVEQYQDETESNYPVTSAIGMESAFEGDELSIDLSLYFKEAADYKVTVLVLESGVVGFQVDYSNGNKSDYVHNDAARIAVSAVLGDEVSVEKPQSSKLMSYKVSVPSKYVKGNLSVLVYVQRAFGSQKVISDGFGDYYVDNCASAKAGAKLSPALK